jgi:FkbM family methyltransferase
MEWRSPLAPESGVRLLIESRTDGVALASGAGEVEFNVTSDDDSSSLLAPSRVQMDAFPGSRPAEKITVNTARLDDTLARDQLIPPVLMKLDVQGGELDALRGATETLATTDFVLVECSFVELYEGQALYDEVISFLTNRGFELAGFYSPTVENGRLLQADALLTRGGE